MEAKTAASGDPTGNEVYRNRSGQTLDESMTEGLRSLVDRLHEAQDIFRQIQMNVFGPQQQELEQLIDRGVNLLSSEYQNLKGEANTGVHFIRDTFKSNPTLAIFAALRIGLAFRQALQSHRPVEPSNREEKEGAFDSIDDRVDGQSIH